MKKVEKYEAFDGQIFDTEKECERYEAQMGFRMFDWRGRGTFVADNATYVYIGSKAAAKEFCELCERQEAPCDGIDDSIASGIAVWRLGQYVVLGLNECERIGEILKRLDEKLGR